MDFCFSHYTFLFVFLKNQIENKRKYCRSELYYPLQQPTLGNVLHRAIVSRNPNPNRPLSPSSICRYTGLAKHAHWFKGLRKPLPCRCHPPNMVMHFANHCHVVTIHWGLSPPLQVQPKFGFCVVDIIDWLCIDPLQGPRKKNPTTGCIQSPPNLSHPISYPWFEMYFILNLSCDFFS